MIKTVITFFFCMTFVYTHSQNGQENTLSYDSYLTLNTLRPTFDYCPRWNIEYIKQIKDFWMVGLELGYGNYNTSPKDEHWRARDYELWEIRPQLFHILKSNNKSKHYISYEAFYINHKDYLVNSTEYIKSKRYIVRGINKHFSYDETEYLRRKFGINVNYGIFVKAYKRVGININVGLGLRNRNVKFSKTINLEEIDSPESNGFIIGKLTNHLSRSGTDFGVNASFNFKITYKI